MDANVARAVFQFFLNGGSDAYVVGLPTNLMDASGTVLDQLGGTTGLNFTASIATTGGGMDFTAMEPADLVPMNVSATNLRASSPLPGSPLDTFDVIITYGSRIETFRGVVLNGPAASAPDKMINGASALVTVAATGGNFGSALSAPASVALDITLPAGFATTFSAADFTGVFDANSSLDKVEIFNLVMVPGVSDNLVVGAALSFAERKRAFAVLDPPPTATADGPGSIDTLMSTFPKSQNGALYFPYLMSTDPITTKPIAIPPSGFVAGIYASTDASRGVWKAPAGLADPPHSTPSGPVPGRGDERPAAGRAEPRRPSIAARLHRRRHRGVGRAHAGREQRRVRAVQIRARSGA